MNKAERAHLLWCMGSPGMWNAGYRWARMRQDEFARRYKRGNVLAWWVRGGHRLPLKPKRGQKR